MVIQCLQGRPVAALCVGARDLGLALMSDNGCQPTALAFMQACNTLGIQQAFPRHPNPTGNADPKRMVRTLTEECLWLQEWAHPFVLLSALDRWMADDNDHYLPSSQGDQSPRQFERHSHLSHGTPFLAA